MEWPESPTCHDEQRRMINTPITWQGPRPDSQPSGETFRSCSYCGSIHPEDLLNALQNGATVGGADWKYGWPHKFYIDKIPNPLVGQEVQMGSRSWGDPDGTRHNEPIMGTASSFTMTKWYNEHLQELSDEAFAVLAKILSEKSGIEWVREDGATKFRAPYYNYQNG